MAELEEVLDEKTKERILRAKARIAFSLFHLFIMIQK